MEKINVAELLRNCPKGMELDCTMFDGSVVFEDISEDDEYPIGISTKSGEYTNLTKYGQYLDLEEAKCVILPLGKTTWEGFVPPCPCQFKDGDIVVSSLGNIHILKNRSTSYIYVDFAHNGKGSLCKSLTTCVNAIRLATEEEKQQLFKTIKDNGYKWNEETKTLEKLIEPKFKIGNWYQCTKDFFGKGVTFNKNTAYYCAQEGCLQDKYGSHIAIIKDLYDNFKLWTIQYAKEGDVLAFNDEIIVIFKDLYNKTSFHSYCHIEDGIFTISKEDMPDWWEGRGFYPATKEQCNLLFQKIKEAGYEWNPETKTLDELVEPKFKDGDVIFVVNNKSDEDFKYEFIAIFKEIKRNKDLYVHGLYSYNDNMFSTHPYLCEITNSTIIEFATEEQKEKLFNLIKINGYKWNEEIKTLEDNLVEPKFKVWDKIKHKDDKTVITITGIKDNYYLIQFYNSNKNDYQNEKVSFKDQDQYELVPDKFDITTLVPFESRVLIRDTKSQKWYPAIWGFYDSDSQDYQYKLVGVIARYCIPYEGNEHLLGKTDDCNEYFKNWK